MHSIILSGGPFDGASIDLQEAPPAGGILVTRERERHAVRSGARNVVTRLALAVHRPDGSYDPGATAEVNGETLAELAEVPGRPACRCDQTCDQGSAGRS